jgi:hypothetical protein
MFLDVYCQQSVRRLFLAVGGLSVFVDGHNLVLGRFFWCGFVRVDFFFSSDNGILSVFF